MNEQTRIGIGKIKQGKAKAPYPGRTRASKGTLESIKKAALAWKAVAMKWRAEQILPPPVNGAVWIPLNKGFFALVDSDVAPMVSGRCWNILAHGIKRYAQSHGNSSGSLKRVYLHREIMRTPKGMQVDHINGNGLDCRRSNMRNCYPLQNRFNVKKRTGKTSSVFKGVSRCSRNPLKWVANVGHSYKSIFLGRFSSEVDAANAYNKAAAKLYGEFALLNVIPNER